MPSPKAVPTPRQASSTRQAPSRRYTMTEDEPSGHGFPTGHEVLFVRRYPPRKAAPGPYKVVAQLPPREGQFQYRIKSGCEPFFRTVGENEIERA